MIFPECYLHFFTVTMAKNLCKLDDQIKIQTLHNKGCESTVIMIENFIIT